MNDRATRIVAAVSLALALVSLTISGWTAMTLSRQEDQLRELAEDMRAGLMPAGGGIEALPMNAPRPEIETDP